MNRKAFLASVVGVGALSHGRARFPGTERVSEMRVQKLAWAGVRIEIEGMTVLLDPLEDVAFFGDAFPGTPHPVACSSARRYVLLTHLHSDHYDREVIRRLQSEEGARGSVVSLDSFASGPASDGLRVRSVEMWEPENIGEITAVAVPAVDGFGGEQVSWVLDIGGTKVFHGGDGLWHGRWWDYARVYGPFDVVFMPINGARTPGAVPPVDVPRTMPPVEAAEAARALGAGLVVPIHYGVTVPGQYEETEDAPAIFAAAAAERGLRVEWMKDGEWLEV